MIYNIENTSKRINNGKIEKTSVEFDNNIKMNEGKVHLEFEYSQVSKIVQTSNFIVLKLGKQSAILVYKNRFTEGSEFDGSRVTNDSYYGSAKAKNAYNNLYQIYKKQGMTDEEINNILVLDVKNHEYFTSQGMTDEHAGLGLFAYDSNVMNYFFLK